MSVARYDGHTVADMQLHSKAAVSKFSTACRDADHGNPEACKPSRQLAEISCMAVLHCCEC